MRIAAQIGVKDEAALIGPCLAHLRAHGVGRIHVQDMGSTDGTLEALAADGGADLVVTENGVTATDADIDRAMRAAARDAAAWGADWLLLLDADEFVLVPGGAGALGALLAGVEAPLALIPRYNVALGPGGLTMALPPGPDDLGRVQLFARAGKWYRKDLEADPTLAWLRFVPLPKTAVRPAAFGGAVHGMHDALGPDGAPLPKTTLVGALVAHVPLSDYDRFARKVANIAEVFALHDGGMPAHFGWHWKRWVASAATGTLRTEYDNSVLDAAAIAALRAEGILRTAAEILEEAGA